MNSLKLSILIPLIIASGCVATTPDTPKTPTPKVVPQTWVKAEANPQEIANAKNSITKILKDPESARFDDFWVITNSKDKRYVCGYVNAKNSFGGYTGKKLFYVNDKSSYIEGSGTLGSIVPHMCSPREIK